MSSAKSSVWSPLQTIALHGFLGCPEDFQNFSKEKFKALDYFHSLELGPHVSWSDWGDHFWQQQELPEKINLVGYSLGGRLALNAFARQPQRVGQLILISAWVWPLSIDEKQARFESDALWAEKFEKLSWGNLLSEWNDQAVFVNSQKVPHRRESEFDRAKLAQAIINWSPARMSNYNLILQEHRQQISYICGEFDKKYLKKSQEYFERGFFRDLKVIEQSGHRVISDQPDVLFNAVQSILGLS